MSTRAGAFAPAFSFSRHQTTRTSAGSTGCVTDDELVRLAQAGDAGAFDQLVIRHQSAVFRAALAALRSPEEAEEAAQDALVRAWQKLGAFRGESAFRTWLTGIAIRVALEIGRSKRLAVAPSDQEPSTTIVPDLAFDLERLIHQLPQGYRQVVVLHDIEGHTHEEIAQLLDIEPGTSKSQLSRARNLLRRWWRQPVEEQRHG